MAVDYEEGRRLLAARNEAQEKFGDTPRDRDMLIVARAEMAFDNWLHANAEALLNPDPWRPLVDLEEKHKDGRIIDLWVRDYADSGFRIPGCKWGIPWPGAAPCWLELKPHPDALHDWEWQPIDFAPTHFRELKGPGQ